MAKAILNSVVGGIRGKSGGFVFRQLGGETFISQQAETKRRRPSAAQKAQRERFTQATYYAKSVLSDPCQREAYEALGRQLNRRADKLVTSDFLTPPVVDRIDVSGYHGEAGGLIRVLASDDVEVVSVDVAIQGPGSAILERGPAKKIHGVVALHGHHHCAARACPDRRRHGKRSPWQHGEWATAGGQPRQRLGCGARTGRTAREAVKRASLRHQHEKFGSEVNPLHSPGPVRGCLV